MGEVVDINANWIAVIPFAYTRLGQTGVRYNISGQQWWGEQPQGIRETIRLAKEADIDVLLKPQVYIPGSWPGALDFESEDDWQNWEDNYKNYILELVAIAAEYEVAMFCIGTEFRISTKKRAKFWINLIHEIRQVYSGKLIYAANWDDYDGVTFWKELDFVGIDAYFPLSEANTPSVAELSKAWNGIMKEIDSFSESVNRKVIFTEYGYLSVDQCAHKNWELEKDIRSHAINEKAQSNALEALISTCRKYDSWLGGFMWKWFPNNMGHEGYFDRDYTPQGKEAESVVRELFGAAD